MLIIHAQGKGIKLRVCIGWRPGVQKIACQTKPPPPSVNVSECYRMLKNLTEGHQPNHKRGKISWRDVKHLKHIKKICKNIYLCHLEKTYDLLLIRKQIILTWLTQVTVDFILSGFISYLVREEKQIQPVSTGKKSVDVIDICVFVFFSSVINTRIVCK